MEINLVVVNVGNSRLAVGTFVAGEVEEAARVEIDRREEWGERIGAAWKSIEGRDNAAIVAAGVNPPLAGVVDEIVEAVTGRRVVWVGKDLELPIRVLTDRPGETGVDRVLNVAAAYEQIEHACIVVDAGTAITVDLCNEAGDFVGGAILPGVRLQLDAMREGTAMLPGIDAADVGPPSRAVGASTREAMLHGVYHGIRGAVKELAETYATELGRWPEIIATGGDAVRLFADWELIHAISPDLTLYGIALAYAEHHIRQDG